MLLGSLVLAQLAWLAGLVYGVVWLVELLN